MKSRYLIIYFLILLTFSTSAQTVKPDHWDEIITEPWFYGSIDGKPAFVYLKENSVEENYFFVADNAIPEIIPVIVKWKTGDPCSASFRFHGKKIKAKFIGRVKNDTLAGYLKTSKKNAIHLGVSPRLAVFMEKEKPQPRAATPLRYTTPVFARASVTKDIDYGAATGYYVSMPVETEGYDYQQILLDAMSKMYVNPTKAAIVHIFNQDPLSFALTDFQPLRMDIYQPLSDTRTNRPLIMLLHGGAFILGDKATETIEELARDFARKGYVVAAINYRIGFNPASKSSLERAAYRAVQDARAALRFLAYNKDLYGIDPNWVFLAGSSAGAITALNTAFMKDEERPESSRRNIFRAQVDLGGLDESTNSVVADYTVRAVVNLWGALSDTNIIDRNENIPVLSVHGNADRIVPYNVAYPFLDMDTNVTSNIMTKLYGSYPVHQRLTHLGIRSELITLPGAGHEPQYEPGKYDPVIDTIINRSTGFYFRSLFSYPDISGPKEVAQGMPLATYTLSFNNDMTAAWYVDGGKILPDADKRSIRVCWLTGKTGTVSAILEHKNGAGAEVRVPVKFRE